MKTYLLLAALILISKYDQVFSDDIDSVEKFEEKTLTRQIVNLLNGTYYNINEKVCQLQRKVNEIVRIVDLDNQCECNETEIIDLQRSISNKLKDFSKTLSGFENRMRLLKKDQEELRELIGGGDSDGEDATTTTTSTTTSGPRDCAPDWISSPEKCYYVSNTSEQTEWYQAIKRCTAMGANLVEIQTDEEAAFLLQSIPSHVEQKDYIYTGRKFNYEDNWVFVSNDKIVDTSARSWAWREPDGGSQRCGCILKSDDFLMADCFCTGYNIVYICEIVR